MRKFIRDYLHHVSSTWQRNLPGFFQRYRLLVFLAAVASIADCLSTIWFMSHDSGLIEVHPVVRKISCVLGPIIGPILGKAVQFTLLIILSIYLRPWAKFLLPTLSIIYLYAAWYNLWGHQLYTPLFLHLLNPLIHL
jgi:hypothetical protein